LLFFGNWGVETTFDFVSKLFDHVWDEFLHSFTKKKVGIIEQLLKLIQNTITWRILIFEKFTMISIRNYLHVKHKQVISITIFSKVVISFIVVIMKNCVCVIIYSKVESPLAKQPKYRKFSMIYRNSLAAEVCLIFI